MPGSTSARRSVPRTQLFSDPDRWVRALQVWLVAGAVAVIAFPVLRGSNEWVGWLPFWLIVAPALDLAILRRAVLARGARTWLARLSRRRRRQAAALPRRRLRTRRHARTAALVAPPA